MTPNLTLTQIATLILISTIKVNLITETYLHPPLILTLTLTLTPRISTLPLTSTAYVIRDNRVHSRVEGGAQSCR